MNVSQVIRITRRLNDTQYIKYGVGKITTAILFKKYLAKLAAYHKGTPYDFQVIREKFLRKIVKYAYKNCVYYRRVFDENNVNIDTLKENWQNVPFLNKDIIRKQQESILAIPANKDYVTYVTTGGSTGQPLGFYRSGGHDYLHQEFLYKIMGYKPGDKILALDGSIVPEELVNKGIYWVKKNNDDLPYGRAALSSQYLNSRNINHYVDFIKEFQPAIIRGYPSFVDDIAKYILANNIEMSFELKGVVLSSESYYEYQLDNIKRAFNTRIFSQYGHSEASIYGYTIDDSIMTYCSPMYGYTEIIGDDDIHVEPGQVGEVVVTGFHNYAMPIIRYRTGDMALYDGEENGIVRLKRIFGRTQDYIYTKERDKVLLTALVFARHYKAFENIEKWQIVQDIPGEITFKIIKSPDFSKDDEAELRDSFYKIAGIDTNCEYVESIPLTPRGKSKFLIQNIPVEV